jgi:uncharacterized membrane protein YccC
VSPLLARLGQRWPDALRMVASGLISFALSSFVLHLPESMWAVLTALIVSRPDMQGAVGAGIGRLAGTIFGAAIAGSVSFGDIYHVPEIALLAAVLVPTSLLAATSREYRTAPIAALIVISSGTVGGSAVGTAVARTIEIALGSLVSVLVTVVFRSRSPEASLARVLGFLKHLDQLMAYVAGRTDRSVEKWRRMQADLRGDLRDLATTAGSVARRQDRERLQGVLRILSGLQTDVLLLGHARRKVERPVDFGRIADAFNAIAASLPILATDTDESRQAAATAASGFAGAVDATIDGAETDKALWPALLGHLADDVGRLYGALASATPMEAADEAD